MCDLAAVTKVDKYILSCTPGYEAPENKIGDNNDIFLFNSKVLGINECSLDSSFA